MKKRKIKIDEKTKQYMNQQRVEQEKNRKLRKIYEKIDSVTRKMFVYFFYGFIVSVALYTLNIVTTKHIHFTIYSFIPPTLITISVIASIIGTIVEVKYKKSITFKEILFPTIVFLSLVLFVWYCYKPFTVTVDYLVNGLQEETVYIENYGPFHEKELIRDVTFNGQEYQISGFYRGELDFDEGEYVDVTYLKNAEMVIN